MISCCCMWNIASTSFKLKIIGELPHVGQSQWPEQYLEHLFIYNLFNYLECKEMLWFFCQNTGTCSFLHSWANKSWCILIQRLICYSLAGKTIAQDSRPVLYVYWSVHRLSVLFFIYFSNPYLKNNHILSFLLCCL